MTNLVNVSVFNIPHPICVEDFRISKYFNDGVQISHKKVV